MPTTTAHTTPFRNRTFGGLASALLAGAAILAFASPSQAQTQELSNVVVSRAPTSETIRLHNKGVTEVRQEVRHAASRVCRNAFLNHEVSLFDVDWCRTASADKAMSRYRTIVKHNRLAGGDYAALSMRIVLSAR